MREILKFIFLFCGYEMFSIFQEYFANGFEYFFDLMSNSSVNVITLNFRY